MSESGADQHRIVVGVDGSESSKHALRWAVPDDVDYEDLARRGLIQTIEEVFGQDRPPRVETRVVPRHPAQALVELSVGAELLVVGCRGYGGVADALLGSVSTYCVHHAHCPVTVIRPADDKGK
jgi:nucleotide-binding universal stress UspA family protein